MPSGCLDGLQRKGRALGNSVLLLLAILFTRDAPTPASFVDVLVDRHLSDRGLTTNPPCDDATFARRSSLDIIGLLPIPSDVHALETDPAADKRARWIDRLLDRPEYADHFASVWSALLRNQRTLGSLSKPGSFAFHAWIREAIAENRPYDQFVAQILTAKGEASAHPEVIWYRQVATPDELASDTAQLFLGVRLQCARCHPHPSDRWVPADYSDFRAFFERLGRKPGSDAASPSIFVQSKGAGPPRLLGESLSLDVKPGQDPRARLVEWLRRPDNPYFARAVVNRHWKRLIGRGLVEPEDDFRSSNPPSDPLLLNALSSEFVKQGYDLKWLIRVIGTSQVYQRSSAPLAPTKDDRLGFARFLPRRLPAEALLDAIDTVTGVPTSFPEVPERTRAAQLPDEAIDSPGSFLTIFGRPKRATACECERPIDANLAQSLHLLNSEEIERNLHAPKGRAALLARSLRPDAEAIRELYLLALSRNPSASEFATCREHLERRRRERRLQEGFEDLIWTLINTKEFQFVP